MGGFWEKVVKTLGFEIEEYEEHNLKNDNLKEPVVRGGKRERDNLVTIHKRPMKLVVLNPVDFDQVKLISDHLKSSRPVIVNLEETPKEDARRILDFISGTVYALGGGIQKVSNSIVLLTPANVEVSADTLEQFQSQGMFPWSKSN